MKHLFVLLVCGFICANALSNGLGKTPQMGWNSWNHYGCGVNETVVRGVADILVSTGLADLGYQYVNVDDCWAASRNAQGVIQVDTKSFPSGMQSLATYVHSKGLRFGLYSDAGYKTCAGRPGSLGYETIDADTYASWGVDYLKYDNCNAPDDETPQQRYPVMRDALNASGRPIFFSMCEWGVLSPWQWAQEVGNSWRTTMDIGDNWDSFIRVLDNNIGLAPFAGRGGWNDPDMLEVGNGGMNENEDRAHFALWCLLKAPLLIGCDVTKMSNATFSTLSAKELIAVNQDPLGVQGDLIYQLGPIQIWAGPLADGSRAFILFNRHSETQYGEYITLNFEDLGFARGTVATIRDLYARENVGVYKDMFSTYVMPHCVFAGRLIPEQSAPEHLLWRPWH